MKKTEVAGWIERIRATERSGDLIVASELVAQGLASYPNSIELRYLAARLLARSGASLQAAALYRHFGLDRRRQLDIAALGARIAKDCALGSSTGRRRKLRSAAASYGRLFARTRAQYPAINAATLYLLAGDRRRANLFARRALSAHAGDRTSLDRYYRAATRAECELILGHPDEARRALQEAARHLRGDFDAAATTRKQLRLVCRATGANADVLDVIRPPAVLHYDGSALAARARRLPGPDDQRALVSEIADTIVRENAGFAYGSLSAGSEILCAETCLRAGLDLHIVLPFNQEEFIETAVRPAGAHWVRRFDNCLRRAKSVTLATTDSYQGDDELFTYACRLAMGLATLRARHLDTIAVHLDCHTGRDPDPPGYSASLTMWHSLGHASRSLKIRQSSEGPRPGKAAPRRADRPPPRHSRALVFGDVKGFSRIPDKLIPVFHKRMMGAVAAALQGYRRRILYSNSWGDAIYFVIDDPVVAAECCLAIQEAIVGADQTRHGLSSDLALRLAAHFGPVYDGHDFIRDEPTFFGAHTTIAARMEPVTPPGQVYVTEAMAAAIALANAPRLHIEYVGKLPMAKGFGSMRMYCLSRSTGSEISKT